LLTASGGAIQVRHLNLAGGTTLTLVYGDRAAHGRGAQVVDTGPQLWAAQMASSPEGSLADVPGAPIVSALPADGLGRLLTGTDTVSRGSGQTLRFVYTAAKGGLTNGAVSISVPPGWSKPSTQPGTPGYVSASRGVVTVIGRAIVVERLRVAQGRSVTVLYGDRTRGGSGAVPPGSDVGRQTWQASERAGSSGSLKGMSHSPQITVLGPNGAGALTSATTTVANGSHGNTITFGFKPPAGGTTAGGLLVLQVPSGWSAPSTQPGDAGYVRSSIGRVTVGGRQIRVTLPALSGANEAVKLVYGGGRGAVAPHGRGGPQEWGAAERSGSTGKLQKLANPVTINVLAPDGSGNLARATSPTNPGSRGQTVAFVYTVAKGGMENGTIVLETPDGWSAPSKDAHAAGYVTSTGGSVSVAGRLITVSGLTLPGGGSVTILYGSRAGGGPGAVAPAVVGPKVWLAKQRSSENGTLTRVS
jgi:hypothetical protein